MTVLNRSVAVSVTEDPSRPDGSDDPERMVMRMFALVQEALEAATRIFLTADRAAARSLVEGDRVIDMLHHQAESAVVTALVRSDPVDIGRRRHHLLILQILPELERSGDLAEHIASHATQGLARWLSPRAQSLVAQMGAIGSEIWSRAAEAYATLDGSAADLLRVRDDEIDDLHVSLTAEVAAGRVSVPVAIEMALVARYFERLGDHAVNVTRRIQVMHAELASRA